MRRLLVVFAVLVLIGVGAFAIDNASNGPRGDVVRSWRWFCTDGHWLIVWFLVGVVVCVAALLEAKEGPA